jgi:hypothetical protein
MLLPNIGIMQMQFTEEHLAPIKDEIFRIQASNFEQGATFNHGVESNIEREFMLIDSHQHLENLLAPICQEYNKEFPYFNRISIMNRDAPIRLGSTWINFQKKHEFNPLHSHTGIYSFVIWIKVPYDIHDEMNVPNARNATVKLPGHFQFAYQNILGQTEKYNIPVDKTYENRMMMFPSALHHQVYPFYTSDGYRISVSGNFRFEI